jgi:hypothetical protein
VFFRLSEQVQAMMVKRSDFSDLVGFETAFSQARRILSLAPFVMTNANLF